MRFFDDLVILGSVAAYPQRRHALAHVEGHHLLEPWIAAAWRAVWSIADADDDAGKSHQVRLERVLDAEPTLMEHYNSLQTAWSEGRRLYDEAETCADRIIARWQSSRYRDAAEWIIANHQQAELDGDFNAALDAHRAQWDGAEHEATAAGAVLDVMDSQQLANIAHDMLHKRINEPESALGPETGWPLWDDVHRGAREGRAGFTIAPTGTGKTSFFLNVADRLSQHTPCLYINLEMMAEDVAGRLSSIALNGRADLNDIEHGRLSSLDADAASAAIATRRLYVTSPSDKTAGAISALMARYAIRHGVKWVCVDHLLEVTQTREERRQGEHWRSHVEWVRRWHQLAVKYGFCLEVIGQCGRDDMDFKAGKEPSFRNMQGASAAINHVDTARIIWRDETAHVVSIKKNRGGVAGRGIEFTFQKRYGIWREGGLFRGDA